MAQIIGTASVGKRPATPPCDLCFARLPLRCSRGVAGSVHKMKLLFWFCFASVGYAYVGYALLLAIYARLRPRPLVKGRITPTVSIIIAARNEETNLPAKLTNISSLEYPPERIQIVIASDGSTDRTNQILLEHSGSVVPVILDHSLGKASALNEAVRRATGDLLVFLDVRQSVDSTALSELASCFADSRVGAASGELLLETPSGESSETALGIYWKLEKAVRKLESSTGSVVGVTGAIYAIRRELYVEIPVGTILDDVFIPMNVVRMSKRVVFEPRAIARDRIFTSKGKEFSRKVRTLSGNYQLLRLAPWLLSPANPLLFRFVSHKLLRLLVPLLLTGMLAASLLIAEEFYRILFSLQLFFYGLAALGSLNPSARRFRVIAIPNTFVMLNAAAATALYNYIRGRDGLWIA